MINKILVEDYEKSGDIKKFIRPFCKLGKCITHLKFGRSYQSGTRFVSHPLSYSDTCTHIFHFGTPNCAKQGVLDACFKIPSENPDASHAGYTCDTPSICANMQETVNICEECYFV